jgi:GH24 family phage-related lysozyme (muramidase)
MTKEFRPALVSCIPGFNKAPISWRAMMLSLAWNIGSRAACNSRAAAFGIKQMWIASCNAATAFNRSGGTVIIGLVNRRTNGDATRIGEGELCLSGAL